GPVPGGWQLETGQFRTVFPAGFVLYSTPADSTSPFDLVGPGSSQIFVQSPPEIPPPEGMCAPGQRIIKSGDHWVEMDYLHQGQQWWQRHQVSGRFVFSAQAPSESQSVALGALKAVLDSLILLG
ncbi:MAG TPA: hypothetical protein VG457_04265, partial [Planctomycetota bacterium]|nr:hypothetical protein [Planctomycetota bacterium]